MSATAAKASGLLRVAEIERSGRGLVVSQPRRAGQVVHIRTFNLSTVAEFQYLRINSYLIRLFPVRLNQLTRPAPNRKVSGYAQAQNTGACFLFGWALI